MKLAFGIVFALLLFGAAVLPVRMDAQDLTDGKERIRSIIKNTLGKPPNLLPSTALAVVHGDEIVWEEAFGWADQQRRIAATTTTPYNIASVSKVFTGMALAILANDGKINMNRSVNAYLGAHKIRPALWDDNAITVQGVADQVGGLSTFALDCETAASCRLESVIDRFGVIVRPPGAGFNYSNLGFAVLGSVIARVSKRSYGDFLRNAVFEPLGMRDCEVRADGNVRGAAVPYVFGTTNVAPTRYSATVAASSTFCSVHSLALLGRALLNPKWSALLPSTGVPAEQTGTPSGTTYSRGWWMHQDYVGTPSLVAEGGSTSAGAMLRLVPAERLAVIALGNTGSDWNFLIDRVVDEFVPTIRERRKTWTPPPPFTRQRRPMAPELVGTWVGAIDTYRGPRPLRLSIDTAGSVTGTFDGDNVVTTITGGGTSANRVFGVLRAPNLGIEEAKDGSYDVQLGMQLYGSRLVGSATTGRDNTPAPQLTFLVDLARR